MKLLQGVIASVAILFGWASLLAAHEFWIEPKKFVLKPGGTLKANLQLGQDFRGSTYPFLSSNFRRFDIYQNGKTKAYKGTEGDLPAVNLRPVKAGLLIMAYESTATRLTFQQPDLFKKYTDYEGLESFYTAHVAAGLPLTGFAERYERNSKALVQVGPYNGGKDRRVGLPAEFVALNSPYAPGTTQVQLQMLFRGKPVPNWAVNVFTRKGGTKLTRHQTNGQGVVTVPFPKGATVMVNAVYMQRTKESEGILYRSWWPNITFGSQ